MPAGTTVFSLINLLRVEHDKERCAPPSGGDVDGCGGGSSSEEGAPQRAKQAQPEAASESRVLRLQANLLEIQQLLRKTAARLPVLALPYVP